MNYPDDSTPIDFEYPYKIGHNLPTRSAQGYGEKSRGTAV